MKRRTRSFLLFLAVLETTHISRIYAGEVVDMKPITIIKPIGPVLPPSAGIHLNGGLVPANPTFKTPMEAAPLPLEREKTYQRPQKAERRDSLSRELDKEVEHDCEIAERKCSETCYPLPGKWNLFRECFTEKCEIEHEDCLTALIKKFRHRRDKDIKKSN